MLHNVHNAHIAHNAHSEAPKSSFGSSEQPVPVFFGSFCPGKRRKLEILSENLNIHNPERARWHKWARLGRNSEMHLCTNRIIAIVSDCWAEHNVMMTCADLTP